MYMYIVLRHTCSYANGCMDEFPISKHCFHFVQTYSWNIPYFTLFMYIYIYIHTRSFLSHPLFSRRLRSFSCFFFILRANFSSGVSRAFMISFCFLENTDNWFSQHIQNTYMYIRVYHTLGHNNEQLCTYIMEPKGRRLALLWVCKKGLGFSTLRLILVVHLAYSMHIMLNICTKVHVHHFQSYWGWSSHS